MHLCPVDRTAIEKRLGAVMLRLLCCSDAEHVTITVAVHSAENDKRSASALLLPQEVGKANVTGIVLDKLEAAAAAWERKGS
jgi:hypothetical protein